MSNKRDMAHRLSGFRASVEDRKHASYFLEEMDGSLRRWRELSAEAKLVYLARDAVLYDVPSEAFTQVVRKTLTDSPPAAREEAALRLVLRSMHELRGLEKLFPDDGQTSSPPLIERFREALGMQSLAGMKAESQRKQLGRPRARDTGMER